MIKTKFDTKDFTKKLSNAVSYSNGFMDGAQISRLKFNQQLGEFVKEALNKYIDAKARMSPESLHHVYEWDQIGFSNARLFEINVIPMQTIIKFNIKFLPSSSISPTSNIPFKNKAQVMENGLDITIEPKNSEMLVFEDGGETVFTKKEIMVSNPGGNQVEGSFEKVINDFFTNYLTVGLLKSSGVLDGLERPTEYKKDFARGTKGGRSIGMAAGKKYMNIGGAEIQ